MSSLSGNKLPNGWKSKKLVEICELITDGSHYSPATIDTGYPYVTVRDVSWSGQIDLLNSAKISEQEFKKLKAGNCSPKQGDVLYSKDGTVGKLAIVNQDEEFVVLSSLAILRPSSVLLSEFLFYSMMSPEFQKFALSRKTGAAIKRVVLRTIKEFQISVPPLEEQKRIVAKIDKIFAKIDKAISLTEESLKQAKNLLPSVLNEVFEKGKADGWEEKKLGEIAFLKSGSTPRRSNNSYWDGGTIPWLKSGELNDVKGIRENSEFVTRIALKETSIKLFEKDTLLIAMYGATAGKLGILSIDATTNQAICSIQNKKGLFNNHFVFYFLFSIREKIIRDSFGGAQPNISKTYLENLTLCLPDLSVQEETVSLCNELSLKAKHTQYKLEEQLAYLKRLKSSILSKAFKGEL